jgi:thiol-disulfide isomerase/thioredoxin
VRLSVPGSALRFVIGASIVGLTLAVLWQAGLLFSDDEDGENPSEVSLEAADAGIETTAPSGLEVGLRPGNLAPDFEFSEYGGERLRLSDLRGRPVFINFWASWCGPCRAEMPDMEVVLRRYEARNLVIIAVNNGETLRAGQRFLDELGVNLSAFAFDPGQDIVRRYAVQGMPTSYFVDAEGVITRVVTGALNERTMQSAVEEAIIGWGRVEAAPR